jgi:hypothetical protein
MFFFGILRSSDLSCTRFFKHIMHRESIGYTCHDVQGLKQMVLLLVAFLTLDLVVHLRYATILHQYLTHHDPQNLE